jgi:hypothetical protein
MFVYSNLRELPHFLANYRGMSKFRFVTPHRRGKWYPDLTLAQRFAQAIGAGFLEPRSGQFIAYAGTRLEVADEAPTLAGASSGKHQRSLAG